MEDDLKNNPFITRIDIDNLTSALRALNMQLTRANEYSQLHLAVQRSQVDLQRQQMDLLQQICAHGQNLATIQDDVASLREFVAGQRPNGDARDSFHREKRQTGG